ncbi:Ppx/GppA phosphatase family protein [Amycolatopsis australiensis]|uniref:Exopolyphosphatase / guanosine-5'-triphosphate,3'-diphosphate pyrophosphatase n=1 Tax=Amycolatopsis australiensis TaxID=546364 RepID=A0A1K1SIV8_9PSEU|nr:Ppx/GppA phosphatase family protein [Amycolatopsis australiensis]SFW84352.1 exopolyphosphatase / guanosine-5'-triphosphate,3'-diphosphate pyrophosphatase [Amycolatopsis australiensis]
MRLAVLDIGSNSAQLQVVDVSAGAPPLPAHAVKEPTLLAEELLPDGTLGEAGVDRVAAAVTRAVGAAVRLGVDQLYPFVTAAVRDAANRDEVIDRIQAESGIRPQFLSGEEEARLTYFAARRWYGWSAGRLLLVDIGGGSMELVLGRDEEPELAISLPLGAGRLTREFLTADPPTRKQLKAVRRHVRDTLSEVVDRLRWEGPARRVVATSKTFKQLARLTGAPPQRKGPFAPRELTVEQLRKWIPRLAAMPAAERAGLRGISRPRARQIVAGAVAAEVTLSVLDTPGAEICPWALREGILLRHLERVADTPELPLQPLTRHPDATVRPLHPTGEQPVPS